MLLESSFKNSFKTKVFLIEDVSESFQKLLPLGNFSNAIVLFELQLKIIVLLIAFIAFVLEIPT